MCVATTMSLVANVNELHSAGIKVELRSEEGNCYITTARNSLVKMFLESECTDMIFVDTDMWFEDKAILKLMQWDKDIVCGVYPKKKDVEEYTARTYIDLETNKLLIDPVTGLIELDAGPTGLMRIQRQVLVKLVEKNPQLKYVGDNGVAHYDLFECFRDGDTWWGEDYAFCHKAKKQGFRIWAEPRIDFCHIGTKIWRGNFQKYIDKQADGQGGVKNV